MCGIFGCLYNNNSNLNPHILKNCLEPLSKRGPDNKGEFIIKGGNFNIFLGHTRLSIIDTSTKANQPMISSSGSLVITFNGEIYNHKQLRTELENNNNTFISSSDTEVLLRGYIHWGSKILYKLSSGFNIVNIC